MIARGVISMSHVGAFWCLVSSLTALGASGCIVQDEDAAPEVAGSTIAMEHRGEIDWSARAWSAASETDVVVAEVNGYTVTAEVIAALKRREPSASPEQLIERAVTIELLAQQGRMRAQEPSSGVVSAWKRALVAQLLTHDFEVRVNAESLPLEQVKKLYSVPKVRKLYDHEDAWRMAHIFFTCCDPKVERCDTDYVMRCFAESGEMIQTVYRELKHQVQDVEGNPDELVKIMEAYRAENEERFITHPFAFRTRPFYYDPETPHEDQSGYTIIAEVVARTVIEGELAVLQQPIQSAFGWHVIAKLDHIPEKRLGVDDPFVIADIRANMLPKVRQARFKSFLEGLKQTTQPVLNYSSLQHLDPGAIGSP